MSESEKSKWSSSRSSGSLETLESPLKVKTSKQDLVLGIPKERAYHERRVALTPRSVKLLVNRGHQIIVESGAGKGSFYSDKDYSEAGASLVYSEEEVFKAHIILKVGPLTDDQISLVSPGQFVISALHIPGLRSDSFKKKLQSGATYVAFEYLEDSEGTLPVTRSMGEIAGTTAMLIAAEYLSHEKIGRGMLLGGVTGLPPTQVVILGAGTVGEFSVRSALGLGADVKLFDNSLYKLRRLQYSLQKRIFTSILEPETLIKELKRADVVVGALSPIHGRTPMVVSEAMVSKMRPGSVIVDVSIDHGGCFETSELTSHEKPVFLKHDVIHYCVPNIPSRVSKSASKALSNVLTPVLLEAAEAGGLENYLWEERGFRAGTYIHRNSCTNRDLSERFQINFTNLELIAAARL